MLNTSLRLLPRLWMSGALPVLPLCAFMSWAGATLPCFSPCRNVPGENKESKHSARCLVLYRTEDFCPLMVAWEASLHARAGGRYPYTNARHSKSSRPASAGIALDPWLARASFLGELASDTGRGVGVVACSFGWITDPEPVERCFPPPKRIFYPNECLR